MMMMIIMTRELLAAAEVCARKGCLFRRMKFYELMFTLL